MCTAVSYLSKYHYFGRNLDVPFTYDESIVITPRKFPFPFRCTGTLKSHYAMIGVATVVNGYPLYYDATNEYGLSMAGLNFSENAYYFPLSDDTINIAPFELIPWVLTQCKSVQDAIQTLKNVQIADIQYSGSLPSTPLHWLVSDKSKSIVIEPLETGLQIHSNPIGILTNSPTFHFHLQNLRQYLNLTSKEPVNRFSSDLDLTSFSLGAGGFGLPGDLTSASRFIRAAFVKYNSIHHKDDLSNIRQFFHILQSVAQQEGCVQVGDLYEKTVYSSCCNTDCGVYYYTTYENGQIIGIDMRKENLDSVNLMQFPLRRKLQVQMEN